MSTKKELIVKQVRFWVVMAGGATLTAACEADGDERKRLWELDVSVYPPRKHYARRAGERRIPVMVLQPLRQSLDDGDRQDR